MGKTEAVVPCSVCHAGMVFPEGSCPRCGETEGKAHQDEHGKQYGCDLCSFVCRIAHCPVCGCQMPLWDPARPPTSLLHRPAPGTAPIAKDEDGHGVIQCSVCGAQTKVLVATAKARNQKWIDWQRQLRACPECGANNSNATWVPVRTLKLWCYDCGFVWYGPDPHAETERQRKAMEEAPNAE